MDPALQHFETAKAQYFVPLCRRLSLDETPSRIGAGYAIAAASSGALRVYFEDERGLCHFSVGAVADPKPMCSVETIAERFPRIRALPDGAQRLTLQEQADLLERHWQELQRMFSPACLEDTRRWHARMAAAYMAQFSGS